MQPMSNVQAPPACKTLGDTGLTPVMMRDILLKTMFRMNLEYVSEVSKNFNVFDVFNLFFTIK